MRIIIASAAFAPHGSQGVKTAKAALSVAAEQGADLLVLPGTRWRREDVLTLSSQYPDVILCAAILESGAVLTQNGAVLLTQPRLYSHQRQGEALSIYTHQSMTLAVAAGEDAYAPQVGRAASLMGACILLCPVEGIAADGPWAQAQQNGLYAIAAPSQGEARIYSPLCPDFPDGIMATGRPGSMAIARLEVVEWARRRISYDPLSALNKPFALSLPQPGPEAPAAPPIRVAAVQRTMDIIGGRQKLLDRMDALCRQAKEQDCAAIVFPEMNWLDAFGSTPLFAGRYPSSIPTDGVELNEEDEASRKLLFPDVASPPPLPFLAHMLLRFSARGIGRLAKSETARLAKAYGLAVHGGTYIERHKKQLYNTAVIALPDGTMITQRKLHLSTMDRMLGMTSGDDLAAFPLGETLAFSPIGEDAAHHEPFLAARRAGCDVALLPISSTGPYYQPAAMRSAWAVAHQMGLFVVQSALTGQIFGRTHAGYAAIHSPLERGDGVLARSKSPLGDELVAATLDFEELHSARQDRNLYSPQFEQTLRRLYNGEEVGEEGEDEGLRRPRRR